MASKQKQRRQQRIDYFMSKPNAKREDFHSLVIITHDPLHVAIFTGRRMKPSVYYRFKEPENLKKFIDKQKKYELKHIEQRKQYLATCEKEKEQFQPGVILCSSWGWEQTNIDFYIILERKPNSVIIQEIGQHREYYRQDQGTCTPNPDSKIGEPFLKHITKHATVNLASYKYCGPWSGKPMSWSSYA